MAESGCNQPRVTRPSPGRGVEQVIDATALQDVQASPVAGIDSLGLWCYTCKEDEPERNRQGVG